MSTWMTPARSRQLDKIGVFMIGETEDICPAAQKLTRCGLRRGRPIAALIVASILSPDGSRKPRSLGATLIWNGAFLKNERGRRTARPSADERRRVAESQNFVFA